MRQLIAATGLTVALCAHLFAHQPQTPQSAPLIFRSGTELATIDIRVTGKDGKPISDLRPDEVHVVDAGVARPIFHLRHVSGPSSQNMSGLGSNSASLSGPMANRLIDSALSSNLGAPRGQLYVLMFDQHHITPGHEIGIRTAAAKFLSSHMTSKDRVAIFGIPGPGPALPFTSDLGAALLQLPSVRGTLEKMVTGAVGEMTIQEAYDIHHGNEVVLNRFLVASNDSGNNPSTRTSALMDLMSGRGGGSADIATVRRLVQENAELIVTRAEGESRRFLQFASTVLRSFRGIDGRKTVLLFSEGFNNENLIPEIQDLAAAAAETYSVIYPFDLNPRQDATSGEARGNDIAREISELVEPLGTLASETGGTMQLDASSHVDTVFDALENPNGDYYVVGFEPPSGDAGKYRRVSIEVTRPGAVVKTRRGYASDKSTALPKRAAIDAALASPYGQQGLNVDYTTYVSRGNEPGKERVVLSLEAELPLANDNRANVENADVVFVVRDNRNGAVAASGTGEMMLPHSTTPGTSTGVGEYQVQFSVPPGSYVMRSVVREPGGLLGSADRTFVVNSMNGPGVGASDLIVAGHGFPVRAQAYTGGSLVAAVRIYGRSSEQLVALEKDTFRLGLVPLNQASEKVIGIAGELGLVHATDAAAYRDVTFALPLASVAPGEYVATASSIHDGDMITSLGARRVVVNAGNAPAAPASTPVAIVTLDDPSVAGKTDLADDLLSEARAKGDPTSSLIVSGITALRSGKYDEAARDLGTAFDRQQDARVAFLLGWARRGSNQDVAAISAFRSATFLDPRLVPAHLALATTYLRMEQPALAAQALRAGLTAVPAAVELQALLETIK